MRRRPAEDRLPRSRPLAPAARARRHPHRAGAPHPRHVRVPEFSQELERVAARYGIDVLHGSQVTEIDGDARRLVVTDDSAGTTSSIDFDFLHTVPPQSAPGWLKATPLADPDNPDGYVEIDKYTLQHTRYGTVFALGDAGSTPNSKTGAAIRKQAPVLVENLLAVMDE